MNCQNILVDIVEERQRQREKWGTQRHDFSVWHVVLAEEAGELAQEILNFRRYNALVQQAEEKAPDALIGALDSINRGERHAALKRMRVESVQCAAVAVTMIEHIVEELARTP